MIVTNQEESKNDLRLSQNHKENKMESVCSLKATGLDLEEGELICDTCNGWGVIQKRKGEWPYTQPYVRSYWVKDCEKCNGAGKLDWVENAVGKRQRPKYGSVFKYDRETGKVKRVD